ncbi:MAG: T9SS type A sorting domain-containing protein [Bacteroidetes bacterium]|nr:T9SS type A sorting domain-containing protein [Bacteroidota bacterium]
MKYFILTIILLMLLPQIKAATISTAQDGNWSDVATWVGAVVPGAGDNVVILTTHDITLISDANCIDLDLQGTATLDISGAVTFIISGDLNLAAGTDMISDDQTKFIINDFTGSKTQLVFPSSMTHLGKLTINRAAGAASDHSLDLDDNVPSAGWDAIVLTNGILLFTSTPSDTLKLSSNDISKTIAATDASHVDGKVSRLIEKDAGWHTFPVGDSSHCRLVELNSTSNGTNRESVIEFHWKTHYDLDVDASLSGGLCELYYWSHVKVNLAGAEPNMRRRFYFNAAEDFPPGFDLADLEMATFNSNGGGKWSAITTGSTLGGTYKEQDTDNASNNVDWAWGSNNMNIVLPLELVSFTGKSYDGYIKLGWTTASEMNTSFFGVERSINGVLFEEINQIIAAGESQQILNYSSQDYYPKPGNNYYRLRQVDNDEAFDYSEMISVNYVAEADNCKFTITPNPCIGKCEIFLTDCSDEQQQNITVNVYDALGNLVGLDLQIGGGNSYSASTYNNLAPGVYIVSGRSSTDNISEKMIVQ